MIPSSNLFPITVVAAIAIFLMREILEAVRRTLANKRKRHALRLLLAAECERNQWVVKWMHDHINEVESSLKLGMLPKIDKTPNGRDRLSIIDKEVVSSAPIPDIKTSSVDKYLFEAASIDAKIFRFMEALVPNLATLSHLRDGLIEHVTEEKEWLDAWAEYAREELEDVEAAIRNLYKACTGKSTTPHRVR